jgi:hypothetical protein
MNRLEPRDLASAAVKAARGRSGGTPSGTARRALPGRHVVAVIGAVLLGAAVLGGCQPTTAVLIPPTTTSSSAVAPIATSTSTSAAPTTTTTTIAAALPSAAPEAAKAPAPRTTAAVIPPANSGGTACGADSYVNSDGNCVHRPVSAAAPPPGATARCRDGGYSFSQHRSGTCSGHGGVAEWL